MSDGYRRPKDVSSWNGMPLEKVEVEQTPFFEDIRNALVVVGENYSPRRCKYTNVIFLCLSETCADRLNDVFQVPLTNVVVGTWDDVPKLFTITSTGRGPVH